MNQSLSWNQQMRDWNEIAMQMNKKSEWKVERRDNLYLFLCCAHHHIWNCKLYQLNFRRWVLRVSYSIKSCDKRFLSCCIRKEESWQSLDFCVQESVQELDSLVERRVLLSLKKGKDGDHKQWDVTWEGMRWENKHIKDQVMKLNDTKRKKGVR